MFRSLASAFGNGQSGLPGGHSKAVLTDPTLSAKIVVRPNVCEPDWVSGSPSSPVTLVASDAPNGTASALTVVDEVVLASWAPPPVILASFTSSPDACPATDAISFTCTTSPAGTLASISQLTVVGQLSGVVTPPCPPAPASPLMAVAVTPVGRLSVTVILLPSVATPPSLTAVSS